MDCSCCNQQQDKRQSLLSRHFACNPTLSQQHSNKRSGQCDLPVMQQPLSHHRLFLKSKVTVFKASLKSGPAPLLSSVFQGKWLWLFFADKLAYKHRQAGLVGQHRSGISNSGALQAAGMSASDDEAEWALLEEVERSQSQKSQGKCAARQQLYAC